MTRRPLLVVLAAAVGCGPSGIIQTFEVPANRLGPNGSTGAVSGAGGGSGAAVSASSGAASGGSGGNSGAAAAGSGSSATASSATATSGASGASSGGKGATGSSSGASTAGLTFTVDMAGGPNRQYDPPSSPAAVSPYVYGFNSFGMLTQKPKTQWGILRHGGDGTTDWNWTNNYSNAAADYCYSQSGDNTVAGQIVAQSSSSDGLLAAWDAGTAYIATVPNLDYVSGPTTNNPWGPGGNAAGGDPYPCPGANGTCDNTANFALACNQMTCAANANFLNNHPRKGSTFCTCAGSGCSGCAIDQTGDVYQDEFVNYLKVHYGGFKQLFFMLDNEPNYWKSTHPEVWPTSGALCSESGTVSFDDVVSRNIEFASAIKSVWSDTKVFGPVTSADGLFYAGGYSDPHLPTPFYEYYLGQMVDAGTQLGTPLIDSFDLHLYSTGSSGAECLQTPRFFWDPNVGDQYTPSQVWNILNGYYPDEDGFFTTWGAPQFVPRLLKILAQAYAGSTLAVPGLSISEYNFGCETTIQGGVAEADGLGVFGREGLYASTVWPLQSLTGTNYIPPAFDLYRNYDGNGSTVGDLAASATTSDPVNTSVYAFTHSGSSTKLELVAINKNASPTTAQISISNAASFTTVTAYHLVDGNTAVVAAGSNPSISCSGGSCTLSYSMPATSATTLVLR